jgi:hypothetical protein
MASEELPRIALGPEGGVFLVGTTASPDLHTATAVADAPPATPEFAGDVDVFVAKLAADGTTLEFLTYLGGVGHDRAGGVAVAGDGSVWIGGRTTSSDFPGTGDTGPSGAADAFIARISADGTEVLTSRLIGGSGVETGTGVALDGAGHVYVTGNSASRDFPGVNAAQVTLAGSNDMFVVRLDPSGRETLYSTLWGGTTHDDAGFAVAADAAGNAYVTGVTGSVDFPAVDPVQPAFGGEADAFVVKLTPSGEVANATTLGGSGADSGLGIAVDATGAVYITGRTGSSDFPTRNALQQLFGGELDAFVTKIAADGGSIVYSTFLGGEAVDVGGGIVVDGAGNAHVTGMTASPDFPTQHSLQPYFGGGSDVFVVRMNDLGTALTYSTFSGGGGADAGTGIAVDGAGNAYVSGATGSDDFPTYNPVQAGLQGPQDAFVTKYCLALVFPQQRELASTAGRDSFAVTTPAGCVWIAFSQSPWITLASPNVVAGPGEVQFEVAANAGGAPRSGALNIAGTEVAVLQAAATDCEYEISPASENFYMQGGVGRINVDTRDDCVWTAVSNAGWISITGASEGTGPGVVSYTVQANRTGRQRSGTISVAGQTFVVFDWIR